jgi:hypothetical protein
MKGLRDHQGGASALASKVEDIAYACGRDAANEYGLLADIMTTTTTSQE